MINAELSVIFERLADLLEISGDTPFRVNTYRRVSRAVGDSPEDVADLAKQGRLGELPGVGKSTVARIESYITTGKVALLEELEAKLPDGLPDLLRIPGLGPKTVARVYHELGVGSTDDLQAAIADGRLAELPGLGRRSVEKIAEGIAFLAASGARTLLGAALPAAEALLEQIRAVQGVASVSLSGSVRRGVETVGDLDIVCEGTADQALIDRLVNLPQVARVLHVEATRGTVTVTVRGGQELQINLRVVPPESLGAALQYYTGSKEHNIRLREIALEKNLRLDERGLFDGETAVAQVREEDIYARLGLPCPPPELREGRDEFDPTWARRELITLEDIRGDLHVHTVASDGRSTIEEMAAAAAERGYKYLGICDHSRSSAIANGLSIEQQLAHVENVHAVNRRTKGIEIFAGTECDILSDSSLDYPDDVLARCDFVMASIHSAMGKRVGKGKPTATERTLAAIANPWVTVIGHPTGRLLNERPPMDIDIGRIAEAAATNHTALELNASWRRLDLKDVHLRQVIEAGVKLMINTDAHHPDSLDQMRYGILTARRGGVTPADVLNTRSAEALENWMAKKRRRLTEPRP